MFNRAMSHCGGRNIGLNEEVDRAALSQFHDFDKEDPDHYDAQIEEEMKMFEDP
jgi:hypothetical protein